MRSSTYLVIGSALLGIVSACCQVKTLGSCCGKGKCNIFCCNCDGGCLPTNQCAYRNCELKCALKLRNPAQLAVCVSKCVLKGVSSTAAMDISGVMDAPLLPQQVLNSPEGMQSPEDTQAPVEPQVGLFSSVMDEQLFHETDQERKGYFTYEEFLVAMQWNDTEDSKSHFQTFDRNGDGKITPDEMRK